MKSPERPPAPWVPFGVGGALCSGGFYSQHSRRALSTQLPSQSFLDRRPPPRPPPPSSLVAPLPGPLHLSPGIPDADQLLQASSAFHLKDGWVKERREMLSSSQAWRIPGPSPFLHEPGMGAMLQGGSQKGEGFDPRPLLLLSLWQLPGSSPERIRALQPLS